MKPLKFLFLLGLGIITANAKASDPTIMLLDSTYIEVKSDKKTQQWKHQKWKVFSQNQSQHNSIYIYEGSLERLTEVALLVYNHNMQLVDRYTLSDFDKSSLSRGTEVDDAQIFAKEYSPSSYPVYYDLQYRKKSQDLISFPLWDASHNGMQVEKASLTVDYPSDYPVLHKSQRMKFEESQINAARHRLHWQLTSPFRPSLHESFSPPAKDLTPWVKLAPQRFQVDQFEGDLSSWEGFARWCSDLMEGRDELPEKTRAALIAKFGSIEDPRARAEAVYKWMQQKTRYISVQLGIGGWQPIAAAEVDKHGYGDCKALTNYTRAALATVGIPAYYALVYHSASGDFVDADFPNNNFNHAILQVPFENDTAWLECTSSITPFDYMGGGTAGHYALVVTNNGGYLTKIRNYHQYQSRLRHHNKLTLNLDGSVSFSDTMVLGKLFYDDYLGLAHATTDELKSWLRKSILSSNPSLGEVGISEKPVERQLIITAEAELPGLARRIGNLLTFSPVVIESLLPELPHDPERQYAVYFPHEFVSQQQFSIDLPQGYQLDYLPSSLKKETKYGAYHVKYQQEDGQLLISYEALVKKGHYPPEQYSELREFLKECRGAPARKIVLIEP